MKRLWADSTKAPTQTARSSTKGWANSAPWPPPWKLVQTAGAAFPPTPPPPTNAHVRTQSFSVQFARGVCVCVCVCVCEGCGSV